MFKLFVAVILTLCALAAARPGYLHAPLHAPLLDYAPLVHHAPVVTKIGAVVHSLPPAISHQSSTVVHSSGHIVTPILAPAVKTVIAGPAYHSGPLLSPYHGLHLGPHYH